MSLSALAGMLRAHADGDGFNRGSNRDVCMHSKGPLRPHASTSSMIACLKDGAPRVAFTGTVHPCISLFKPIAQMGGNWTVCNERLFAAGEEAAKQARADADWRAEIRRSIETAESDLLAAIEKGELVTAEDIAAAWSEEWLNLTPGD